MTIRISWLASFLGALCLTVAGAADAYFEIELTTGGTIVADSYTEDGGRLRLYRPSGELEVERTAVRAIREKTGALHEMASSRPSDTEPPGPVGQEIEVPSVPASAAPVTASSGEDLTTVERDLTRKLILANRNLLFARNAGEDKASLRTRQKAIEAIQEERESVRKRLGL